VVIWLYTIGTVLSFTVAMGMHVVVVVVWHGFLEAVDAHFNFNFFQIFVIPPMDITYFLLICSLFHVLLHHLIDFIDVLILDLADNGIVVSWDIFGI
jgi:hypothetical protein